MGEASQGSVAKTDVPGGDSLRQAHTALQRSLHKNRLLSQLARMMLQTSSLDALCRDSCRLLCQGLQETNVLLFHQNGIPGDCYHALPIDAVLRDTLSAWAATADTPHAQALPLADGRSLLAVSHRERDDIIALALHRPAISGWTPNEYELLEEAIVTLASGLRHCRLYEALQRRNAELAASLERMTLLNQQQRDFIAMASHEFRTPLAIIDSSVQLLERQQNMPDLLKRQAQKIRRASLRMTGLMESTLLLGRAEAGQLPFQPRRVDVRALVEEALGKLYAARDSRQWDISLHALPASIQADPALIEHLLGNLLSNAIKYSPEHSLITLHGRQQGDRIELIIENTGHGIAPLELPRIFEKYYRAANSITQPGTGIGLYLCKRFAELHGGSLEAACPTPALTRFTLRLPLEQAI